MPKQTQQGPVTTNYSQLSPNFPSKFAHPQRITWPQTLIPVAPQLPAPFQLQKRSRPSAHARPKYPDTHLGAHDVVLSVSFAPLVLCRGTNCVWCVRLGSHRRLYTQKVDGCALRNCPPLTATRAAPFFRRTPLFRFLPMTGADRSVSAGTFAGKRRGHPEN